MSNLPEPQARPQISIVLPTYNGMRYIEESIDSCLRQTIQDFELIIVDDCSTDDTPNIIKKYNDPRIISIRHEQNKKLPAALNTGFSASRGAYLTWTSDDNRYHPEALEVLLSHLLARPDVGMVYSAYQMIDTDGKPVRTVKAEPAEALREKCVVGASFMYRREVYERVGDYDENLFRIEDYDYFLRIAAKFKIMPIQDCIYDYRVHPGSLTSTESYMDRAIALDKLHTRVFGPDKNRVKRTMGEYYISNVFESYLAKKYDTILKNAFQAIKYNPGYLKNKGFLAIIAFAASHKLGIHISR